jgi:hypothetical protein
MGQRRRIVSRLGDNDRYDNGNNGGGLAVSAGGT